MVPLTLMLWLTISLGSVCLIEDPIISYYDYDPMIKEAEEEYKRKHPECWLDAPVCGEANNFYKDGKRYQTTFPNECKLKEHNSLYGSTYYKLNDGPCGGCKTCKRDVNPVCYTVDGKGDRAFLNACFYERYLCLHGVLSVGFKVNDGRCKICKGSMTIGRPSDQTNQKVIAFNQRNLSWQNQKTDCVDDNTPLIAE